MTRKEIIEKCKIIEQRLYDCEKQHKLIMLDLKKLQAECDHLNLETGESKICADCRKFFW
ncbi:MAG: hypothetical protein A2934_02910 [Candidatus Sungbacteria bacterium RIFCSPLOWO2_01_FULL_47_10]|uniref:Uncharacterized protein n=1 Tax=Candidatus Sungbacteria bacterium RIFCSPLOWO2_01_FULL_47_10 TaxID=1802276 RepID=A0A1G2LAI6_9BACT|nr:MAG: hypothetical protein A2934_02910 [Candidatus Sungbacteria bacterium RIFCSPLOWO2_01_FULL_47_10]